MGAKVYIIETVWVDGVTMSIKEVVKDVKDIMHLAKDMLKKDDLSEQSLLQMATVIAISKLTKSTQALSEKIDEMVFSLDSNSYVDEEEMGYS